MVGKIRNFQWWRYQLRSFMYYVISIIPGRDKQAALLYASVNNAFLECQAPFCFGSQSEADLQVRTSFDLQQNNYVIANNTCAVAIFHTHNRYRVQRANI